MLIFFDFGLWAEIWPFSHFFLMSEAYSSEVKKTFFFYLFEVRSLLRGSCYVISKCVKFLDQKPPNKKVTAKTLRLIL